MEELVSFLHRIHRPSRLEQEQVEEGAFRCHLGLPELAEVFGELLVGEKEEGDLGEAAKLVETMVEGLDEIFDT